MKIRRKNAVSALIVAVLLAGIGVALYVAFRPGARSGPPSGAPTLPNTILPHAVTSAILVVQRGTKDAVTNVGVQFRGYDIVPALTGTEYIHVFGYMTDSRSGKRHVFDVRVPAADAVNGDITAWMNFVPTPPMSSQVGVANQFGPFIQVHFNASNNN